MLDTWVSKYPWSLAVAILTAASPVELLVMDIKRGAKKIPSAFK